MQSLLIFLDNYLNRIIIILGFLDGAFMLILALQISSTFKGLEDELMIPDDGSDEVLDVRRLAKLSVANGKRDKFDNLSALYNLFSQFIPIFPLLGILGTVAGLIINAQAGSDVSRMQEALGLALYSTLYGLFASIVLKIIDTIVSNLLIAPIESIFDNYDANFIMHELRDQDDTTKKTIVSRQPARQNRNNRYPANRGAQYGTAFRTGDDSWDYDDYRRQ